MKYTIVGAGRIGTALYQMSDNAVLVRRKEKIPAGEGPIIVATRNNDLEDVVSRTPTARRSDLLFVQNGMLQSWLHQNKLHECTQAQLYFAVSHKGAKPVDGGGSVVHGKWAEEFCTLLSQANIVCEVVEREAYLAQVAEKFLWNCTFGVLSQYFDCSVGTLCTQYENETRALIDELKNITVLHLGVQLDEKLADRLFQYSLSIYDYRGALKEWSWRNGWLWERKKTDLHRHYLAKLIEL